MSMKLLFVGAVNRNAPPANGEEYKNQMLLGYLDEHFRVNVIDTKQWSREPVTLIRLVIHMLMVPYDRILISASSASVFRLLDSFRFFKSRLRKTIYFVIGGYLPKALADGRYKARAYQSLMSLVVEGESMRKQLRQYGIVAPVHVVPNFKTVDRCRGSLERYDDGKTKFIFVSRIVSQKGVDTIFQALSDPRLSTFLRDFVVHFFGPVEKGYVDNFNSNLHKHEGCQYKGYLDFSNQPEASYEIMSTYHAMLFPTFWIGEGFPGAILDAFICGIPVIATDWNMNGEVIEDGKTGRLIPVQNPKALADAMLDVMVNRECWKMMSSNCHERAPAFDTNKVLQDNLNHII